MFEFFDNFFSSNLFLFIICFINFLIFSRLFFVGLITGGIRVNSNSLIKKVDNYE